MLGAIDAADSLRFKRMVFRATKGNVFILMSDIEEEKFDFGLEGNKEEDQIPGEKKESKLRSAFFIAFSGGTGDFMK